MSVLAAIACFHSKKHKVPQISYCKDLYFTLFYIIIIYNIYFILRYYYVIWFFIILFTKQICANYFTHNTDLYIHLFI